MGADTWVLSWGCEAWTPGTFLILILPPRLPGLHLWPLSHLHGFLSLLGESCPCSPSITGWGGNYSPSLQTPTTTTKGWKMPTSGGGHLGL